MKALRLFCGVGILFVLGHGALAAVPKQMNFQGVLSDSGGSPLDDTTISVVFTIYDAATAGTSKWTETQSISTNGQGQFTVILGLITPIEDSVFAGTERFLGIKVGSDPEMPSRVKLVGVPYAQRIATVNGATGGAITGELDVSGMSNKIRFHFNDISEFPSAAAYHGMFAHSHNQGAAYYAHAGQWVRLADSAHVHNTLAAADNFPNPAVYVDSVGKVGVGTYMTMAQLNAYRAESTAFPAFAVMGIATNSSSGAVTGGVFSTSSDGTGIKTGVRGGASSAGAAPAYGVYGEADNGSTGEAYGGFFNVPTGSDVAAGAHYGVSASAFGIDGPVYGGYFFTDTTGSATKYGVYASGPTAEGWAGYFQGNVRVTDTLRTNYVSSYFPMRIMTNGLTRIYIDNMTGNVGVGTSTPASALQVNGYVQLATTTVAPPGVDCDEAAEAGRMKFNSTTGTLYICSGAGGWITK